ncbi:MAG: thiamine phosphate synthase, partial [Candidatus Delongbacteria bacterium]
HCGQDDLPVSEVRRIAPHLMVGVSTHSPEQALKAVKDGADYIGVGPIFSTKTKKNVCDAVGFEYLEFAVRDINIPFVAIGGIKEHNIGEVVKRSAKTIALVTEIVGAENIKEKIEILNNKLKDK